jgi:hypothetical protein
MVARQRLLVGTTTRRSGGVRLPRRSPKLAVFLSFDPGHRGTFAAAGRGAGSGPNHFTSLSLPEDRGM